MKIFEDGLRKRFDGASAEEEVDADALWSAIKEGLPGKDQTVQQSLSWWRWPAFGLLLLGITVGGYFSIFSFDREKELKSGERVVKVEDNNDLYKEVPSELAMSELKEGVNAAVTRKTDKLLDQNLANATTNESIGGTSTVGGLTKNGSQPDSKESNHSFDGSRFLATKDPELKQDQGSVNQDNEEERGAEVARLKDAQENDLSRVSAVAITTDKREKQVVAMDKLVSAPLALLIVPKRDFALPPISEVARRPKPFGRQASRFGLGLYAGTNLLLRQYKSSSSDDVGARLNRSKGEALGQSGSLELQYRFTDHLSVISGFAMARHHTTFSFVTQRDTLLPREGFPGQTIAGMATRTVDHNNLETAISVPLMLEYARSFGDFELGIAGGVAWNKLIRQSGKLLNSANRIITYAEGGGGSLPTTATYLSYQLRPALGYALSGKTMLQLRTDVSYQNYGASPLFGGKHQAFRVGVSVGVRVGL
ncbi:MAG: hypothetical protein AAGF89_09370 [Bacteroidota bacterium]